MFCGRCEAAFWLGVAVVLVSVYVGIAAFVGAPFVEDERSFVIDSSDAWEER